MSDVDGKQLNKGHSNVCEKGELDYNGDKYRPQENLAVNVVDVTDRGINIGGVFIFTYKYIIFIYKYIYFIISRLNHR